MRSAPPEAVEDLAACPFCGGEAHEDALDHGEWLIGCEACNARPERSVYVTGVGRDEAIAAWNRRTPTTPKPAGDALDLAGLEALLAESEGAWPKMPWQVVASDGKPTIRAAKNNGGNLFRGYIATWAEADLACAAVNALPGLIAHIRATDAELAKAREERDELRKEAEIFDEEHADQNRMVDRIADLIGVSHDEELDTTAFELWFSASEAARLSAERDLAAAAGAWMPMDSAPFDRTVLVDCERFDEVCEAIQYRTHHTPGEWTTFGPNGAFACRPRAWREKPARTFLAAHAKGAEHVG